MLKKAVFFKCLKKIETNSSKCVFFIIPSMLFISGIQLKDFIAMPFVLLFQNKFLLKRF